MGEVEVALGAAVLLTPEDEDEEEVAEGGEAPQPPIGLVQAMWQTPEGALQAGNLWRASC